MSSTSPTAAFPPPTLLTLAKRVAELLTSSGKTLCVAESSSGGLISASLLAVDGAGAWYRGGGVLYTLESRIQYGGWTDADVQSYRGPNPQVVTGLATNVCKRLGADYCIGETGLAAPSPRTRRFPDGLTCLALSSPEGGLIDKTIITNSPDRHSNMLRFAEEALRLVVDFLEVVEDIERERREGEKNKDKAKL